MQQELLGPLTLAVPVALACERPGSVAGSFGITVLLDEACGDCSTNSWAMRASGTPCQMTWGGQPGTKAPKASRPRTLSAGVRLQCALKGRV